MNKEISDSSLLRPHREPGSLTGYRYLLVLSKLDVLAIYILLLAFALVIVLSPWRGDAAITYVKLSALILIFTFFLVLKLVPVSERGFLHPIVFTVIWWGGVRELLPKISVFANGLERHAALGGVNQTQLDYVVAESTLYYVLSIVVICISFAALKFKGARIPKMVEPKHVYPGLSVLAVLSLLSFGMFAFAAGGLGNLIMQRGISVSDRVATQIGAHWVVLATLLEVGCYVALSSKKGIEKSFLFWFFVLLSMFIGFASTGSRSGVIMQLVFIAIIYSIKVGRIPYRAVFSGVFVSILLVGGLGEVRTQMQKGSSVDDIEVNRNISSALASGAKTVSQYAGEVYGLYGVVGKVPEDVPFLNGESYKSILYIPFPSAIVGEKPLSGGRLASDKLFNNPQSGVPPTYVGEAYWNFGLAGVLVVSVLWGVVLRFVYDMYRLNVSSALMALPFLFFLFYARPDSNSLVGAIQALVVLYFSYFVISLFGRLKLGRGVSVG